MVRVNLIEPVRLADQHLIAEYNEILMLLGYVRKNPILDKIPKKYCLGTGHIKFFKDKLTYLKKRHETIKKEMKSRGFKTDKKINLDEFPKELVNDWAPENGDYDIIKERISWKIKTKPNYYRYKGEKKEVDFFLDLLRKDNISN